MSKNCSGISDIAQWFDVTQARDMIITGSMTEARTRAGHDAAAGDAADAGAARAPTTFQTMIFTTTTN